MASMVNRDVHASGPDSLQGHLEGILASYSTARKSEPFNHKNSIAQHFKALSSLLIGSAPVASRPHLNARWSIGQGSWGEVPWLALMDSRETTGPKKGVYCVLLFRGDMSGMYWTYLQGVTEPIDRLGRREGREELRQRARALRQISPELPTKGFNFDSDIDLRGDADLGKNYEVSTIGYRFYAAQSVPDDAAILGDVEAMLTAYDQYLATKFGGDPPKGDEGLSSVPDTGTAVQQLIERIAAKGFVFEPWQIAAYCTALRTKPFAILAGVSGTGKSALPRLVAELTGGNAELLSVRPDWTDSSEVLGYVDLQNHFRPGRLAELMSKAAHEPDKHFVCIVDEMNLARVEHYFAEVLSAIEARSQCGSGGYESCPILNLNLDAVDAKWRDLRLPPNLALVGTVNMDESAHGFSRKVLDRAFTMEFSDIDLQQWQAVGNVDSALEPWPVSTWFPRAIQLHELDKLSDEERATVEEVIATLTELNRYLTPAQLQVGYRTRDEIALFALHAIPLRASFVTRSGQAVKPLDLALHMKVLPRIVGGSNGIRRLLLQLLGWSRDGKPLQEEDDATDILKQWREAENPWALAGAKYPRTAARLCLMLERLASEGFTSYWL